MLVPYHFILAMQNELQVGRHEQALALLSGDQSAAAPKGAVYLRAPWLSALLFGAAVVCFALTTHLLDNLQPGPHMNLFVQLVYIRILLFFGLGLACLMWYVHACSEIKREC